MRLLSYAQPQTVGVETHVGVPVRCRGAEVPAERAGATRVEHIT